MKTQIQNLHIKLFTTTNATTHNKHLLKLFSEVNLFNKTQ